MSSLLKLAPLQTSLNLPKFKKVLPHDYDKMLRLIAQMEEKGEDSEQAQMEAFYAMKNAK